MRRLADEAAHTVDDEVSAIEMITELVEHRARSVRRDGQDEEASFFAYAPEILDA
jgi:hypothetical protein